MAQECQTLSSAEETRIATLVASMSLDEKIAQMRIFHANADARVLNRDNAIMLGEKGQLDWPASYADRIANGIAGIKNPGEHFDPEISALVSNALQRRIIESQQHSIPALFIGEAYSGLDAEGATRFARPIGMASTWNPDLVRSAWDVIGREARLRGWHMIHSPVADIHRDPRFGRMSEGFGEDAHLAAVMVESAVKGVQGGSSIRAGSHIGAVIKHFVGYGQVDGGRNFASVSISERDLRDEYLKPFAAGIRNACALGVMPSHGDINGVPSHGNPWLLRKLLRDEWGFEGYVVSDAEDVARLGFFMGTAENDDDAAMLGLRAGVDIDLYSERGYANLGRLAKQHSDLVPLIDEAVANVLGVKMHLGLFDNPYVDPRKAALETRTDQSRALAAKVDAEAVTMLKNANSVLPLNPSSKHMIALVGPLLDEEIIRAFEARFKAGSIVSEIGLRLTNGDELRPELLEPVKNVAAMERLVDASRNADVVIAFIGDDELTAREAYFRAGVRGDRADLAPVPPQTELVRRLAAVGKPLVVVSIQRRSLAISEIDELADALLLAWEPGEGGPQALAGIVAGDLSPSGRLPVSIPRSAGHLPVHYSQKRINFHKEYLFSEDGPLYPFGYGLTFGDIRYESLRLSSSILRDSEPLTATVALRNAGQRPAAEVVQLYVSDPVATVTRPRKLLKDFRKVELAPGQSATVDFPITPEMLAHTGADYQRDPGYGAFTIEIASSSAGHGVTADLEYRDE